MDARLTRRLRIRGSAWRSLAGLALALALATTALAQQPPQQVSPVVVGPNVNMVGGPASYDPSRDPALIGDPFLQRQNEPSLALSSRNPCHILAGANDYRAVDLEEAVNLEHADAWLGVFKSLDCGYSWTSYLLPGHPVDSSPAGLTSPLRGLQAAADATVRAGTSGLFYYSGIAFDRGDSGVGKVFVARFIDNNNKDGADPIKYLDTTAIDTGTSGQFLDKPWIATDVPRGSASCTVDGQSVPAGNVYLTHSAFVGSGNNVHTKILFSRSTDCGATWSNPSKLSERVARNQGTVMAVDPGTGAIYIAWREFTDPNDAKSVHAILVVKSTDGGKSFTPAQRLTPANPLTGQPYAFQPFDQIATPVTFRTNAYPTMAIVPAEAEGRPAGQPGRVYLAWAARGFGGARPTDARIVMSSSIDGVSWTSPTAADDQPGAGHQIMPALTFAGGKLAFAYYDLRRDAATLFQSFVVEYGQQYWQYCVDTFGDAGAGFVLSCMTANNTAPRRHTLDLRAAMADPACLQSGACAFTSSAVSSTEVSRYIEGALVPGSPAMVQRQYNRPNLPLFRKGTYPFIGDYIDIAGPVYLPDGEGGWTFNSGQTAGRPAPVFHVSWADNRDVKKPASGDWGTFTPSLAGPNGLQCVPGQAGIRNQNIYAAQLRPGLSVAVPLNAKKVTALQRSFVVVTQNATSQQRTYSLSITPPSGVIASFDQFLGFDGASASLVTISAVIPPRSSISRTVFVGLVNVPADPSQAPHVVVPVVVTETGSASPSADTVYLNPDFDNPDFDNPDFDNAEMHNPDFDNPDFDNPDFDNPDFDNFTLNTSFRTPDFDNPDFDNPDFDNPDFDNPDFDNPDFDNPDFDNPDFDNPDFDNPDFDNPDFDNPDFDNAAVADITWPVYNTGNTTSAYKANINVNNPPGGVKYQLLVRRAYPSPAPSLFCTTGEQQSVQNQALVNIVQPDIAAYLRDRNFNDSSRTNATFYLAPGEKAKVTLRAYCAASGGSCPPLDQAWALSNIAMGTIAQAANCVLVAGATECSVDDGPPKDIYDPVPPVVFGPAPQPTAVDANNDGSEPMTFVVTATDNLAIGAVACVGGPGPISPISAAGDQYTFASTFPVGTTAVVCTASDVRTINGVLTPNTASVTFDVVVRDVSAPTFDPTQTIDFTPGLPAEATSPDGAIVNYTTPTASDSNGGPVTVTCAPFSGSTFPIGVTPIDCTATDDSGNSTPPTNLFDVTVVDTTAPVIAPASNLTQEATGAAGAAVTYTSPSWTDTVSGTGTATCAPASGSTFALGATTVTCDATDGAGNPAISTTFSVTVVDTTAPVTLTASVSPQLLWPPDGTIVNVTVSGQVFDAGSGAARIAWSVIDEYGTHQPTGTATVTNGPYSFQVPLLRDRRGNDKDGRNYTIRLTAYDQAGNSLVLANPLVINVHDQSGK